MKPLIGLILVSLLFSCDPCLNCGEPLNYDPTVELIFINNDTLVGIESRIATLNDELILERSNQSIVTTELDSLEKRLEEVIALIEGGDSSLETERTTLVTDIETYTDSLEFYEQAIHVSDSIKSYWTSLQKDVSAGLIKIDTLYIGGQLLAYQDSSKSYHVPLLMNDESFTQYEIIVGDYSGEIAFDYELKEFVDAKREIKLRAYHITPVSHTFDSISDPFCKTSDCLDSETTVYIYF